MTVQNWLLLRGLVREQRHWGSFSGAVAERMGVRVQCLVFPGTGTEHTRESPGTIAGIVDDIRARLDRGEGTWGIFAVSLGGMVALDWADRYPDDFARVVVCNTSAGDLSPVWHRMRPQRWPRVVFSALSTDVRARERRILEMTTNRADIDRETLSATWAGYAADAPVARAVFARQLSAATRSKAPTALSTSVSVLVADGDNLVNPACSKQIAARLGIEPQVHPWGGHDLALDDPAWVLDHL